MKRRLSLTLLLAALLSSPAHAQQAAGAANIATGQVSVGTGATLIAARRSGGPGVARVSITVVNSAQAVSFCVGAAGVSAATGVCLPAIAGASITLNTVADVYGIWADGSTHSVGFVETY
jgi:hypothetical protein